MDKIKVFLVKNKRCNNSVGNLYEKGKKMGGGEKNNV
jgi:hypothetical protein